MNKEDNSMNDEVDTNIGDLNLPADGISINNIISNSDNNAVQTYY